MSSIVHTEEYKGYTIEVHQDDHASNPYEDWDMFGTMIHWHRRGFIGEDYSNRRNEIPSLIERVKKSGGVVVPVFLYEHSGQTINTTGFSCPWDSGQVGFMYATPKQIRENYMVKRITAKTKQKALDLLTAEIKTLDDYLTGNVYGFIIKKDDEEIDSCWGFYGDYEDGLLTDARANVDAEEKHALPLLDKAGLLEKRV